MNRERTAVAQAELSKVLSSVTTDLHDGRWHPTGILTAMQGTDRVLMCCLDMEPDQERKVATFEAIGGLLHTVDSLCLVFEGNVRSADGSPIEFDRCLVGIALVLVDHENVGANQLVVPFTMDDEHGGARMAEPFVPNTLALELHLHAAMAAGVDRGPLSPRAAAVLLADIGHRAQIPGEGDVVLNVESLGAQLWSVLEDDLHQRRN